MYSELKIVVTNEITETPITEVIDFTLDTTLVQVSILSMMEQYIFEKDKVVLNHRSKSRFINGTHQNITTFLDADDVDNKLFYTAIWLPERSDIPFSVELTKLK